LGMRSEVFSGFRLKTELLESILRQVWGWGNGCVLSRMMHYWLNWYTAMCLRGCFKSPFVSRNRHDPPKSPLAWIIHDDFEKSSKARLRDKFGDLSKKQSVF
jgi:hypothetical protein